MTRYLFTGILLVLIQCGTKTQDTIVTTPPCIVYLTEEEKLGLKYDCHPSLALTSELIENTDPSNVFIDALRQCVHLDTYLRLGIDPDTDSLRFKYCMTSRNDWNEKAMDFINSLTYILDHHIGPAELQLYWNSALDYYKHKDIDSSLYGYWKGDRIYVSEEGSKLDNSDSADLSWRYKLELLMLGCPVSSDTIEYTIVGNTIYGTIWNSSVDKFGTNAYGTFDSTLHVHTNSIHFDTPVDYGHRYRATFLNCDITKDNETVQLECIEAFISPVDNQEYKINTVSSIEKLY